MGERPIDDAVDGLNGLRDEAGRETEAVMDLVRGDLAAVQRLVAEAARGEGTPDLSTELDAIGLDMSRGVERLGGELGAAVDVAAAEIEALRRPAAGKALSGQRPDRSETPEPATGAPTVLSVSSTAEEDLPILREPPPDTVIVVDDTVVYRTDSLGRVELAEVVLKAISPEQPRNARAQQIVKDKLPGDHAGHLIARVLGGIGEAINLTPMEGRSVNMGQYRALENEWRRAIDRGQEVDLRIRLVYDDDTARPSKFVVWYQIGEVPYKETIKNLPADARER